MQQELDSYSLLGALLPSPSAQVYIEGCESPYHSKQWVLSSARGGLPFKRGCTFHSGHGLSRRR